MRIGLDVRYLTHGLMGGIHTYLMGLVPALAEVGDAHEFVLYGDAKAPFDLDIDSLGAHVTLRLLPYRNALSSMQHDLFMHRQMAKDGIEVAHFPANYGFGPRNAATVVTVHDTMTLKPIADNFRHAGSVRSWRDRFMAVYLNATSLRAVRNADLLLTISEHARMDIAGQTGRDASDIIVASHAPGDDMQRIEDGQMLVDVRKKYDLPAHFVLADGLKNPAVIIRAWDQLPESLRTERRIVFFSRTPNLLPIVGEAVERGVAQVLIRPSRTEVVCLYNLADVFVFPSWYEGFGIPIIEAMACGAPVIASDRYCIPEVAGGAALIMDAEDDATLAAHLTAVLGDPAVAEGLRRAGYKRITDFSWQRSAETTLHAYERAHALRSQHSGVVAGQGAA